MYKQSLFYPIKKRRFNILMVFSLLIFSFNNCSEKATENYQKIGTWTIVNIEIENRLYDTDFINPQNGWVVGDNATILNTSNGGQSWHRQISPLQGILSTIDFVDEKNGWICGRNTIIKTINGGNNWQVVYNENLQDGYFQDIQFLNKKIGFAVGGKGPYGSIGFLIKTEDGGDTWQSIFSDSLSTLTHISISNDLFIMICGFGGTILTSLDKGKTWNKKNLTLVPPPSLTNIQFVDSIYGWTSSRDDYLGFYLTNNGGKSWIRIDETSFMIVGGVQSFYFINKNLGWMCNFPFNRILKTTDSGLTWEYDSEIRERINAFKFINIEEGWAVGNNGTILKYSLNTY